MMLTAFFGGPFAVIALTGINSHRLGRDNRDAAWLFLAVVVTLGVLALVYRSDHLFTAIALEPVPQNILIRAFALLLFGGSYLLHRRYYRSMALVGIDPPRALPVALPIVFVGLLLLSVARRLVQQ